jgi:hypothetical protein
MSRGSFTHPPQRRKTCRWGPRSFSDDNSLSTLLICRINRRGCCAMARIPEGCFENSPARSTATCGEKASIVPAPRGGASGFRFDAPPRGADSRDPCTPHVAVLRAGLLSLCPCWGRQAAMRLPYWFRPAANPDRVTSVRSAHHNEPVILSAAKNPLYVFRKAIYLSRRISLCPKDEAGFSMRF